MCALEHRRNSGAGQQINLSQLEATVASIGDLLLDVFANDREPEKLGNGSLNHAPQGCYPCAGEERWCVISVANQGQWRALCQVLERPLWLEDGRFIDPRARQQHRQQLDALLADTTRQWQATELMHGLQQQGVAAGVVQNVEDQYLRDPHLAQRHYFETIKHQLAGEVVAPGIPLGLTGTPGKTRDSGRPIGCDNEAIFCDLLGLPASRYRQLLAAGIIET
jgi:benzylsuccinate CoA-transferase BbsF subunit